MSSDSRKVRKAMETAKKSYAKKLLKKGWSKFEDVTERKKESFRFEQMKNPDKLFSEVKKVFMNNIYLVMCLKRNAHGIGEIDHLMIRRNDGLPCRSWTDMQKIKDEIIGEERIGFEVYPKKKDVVDGADMYHMWVMPENYEIQFGLHLKVF